MLNKQYHTHKSVSATMVVISSLLVGLVIGGSLNLGDTVKPNMSASTKHTSAHHHQTIEWNSTTPPPRVTLEVYEDSLGGWNLHLNTQNFIFAPQSAGGAHVWGEGHAHIYVDGEKVARAYSEWFHLPDQKQGNRVIRVELTTNTHQTYSVNGTEVGSEILVQQL